MGFVYSSANGRWQALRSWVLRRDGHQCQYAKRFGRVEPAEVVHHIWPAEDYPEFAYCRWNLISLSKGSHNLMHTRGSKELSEIGERLRLKTTPPRSDPTA